MMPLKATTVRRSREHHIKVIDILQVCYNDNTAYSAETALKQYIEISDGLLKHQGYLEEDSPETE